MGKPLSVGNTVIFRLYNTLDKHFYGAISQGVITEISKEPRWNDKIYHVKSFRFAAWKDSSMWLHRKEILRRVK